MDQHKLQSYPAPSLRLPDRQEGYFGTGTATATGTDTGSGTRPPLGLGLGTGTGIGATE